MNTNQNTVTELLITVNEQDEYLGTIEKLAAHKEGILHRAFSIFLMNDKDELLLQQRAHNKYHSGSLWTNSCCSHPKPGEDTLKAAHRRLQEEMGIATELHPLFELRYTAAVGNGLVENEYDHIFTGIYNGEVIINKEEVCDYRWLSLPEIMEEMRVAPQRFTRWFTIALPGYMANMQRIQEANKV